QVVVALAAGHGPPLGPTHVAHAARRVVLGRLLDHRLAVADVAVAQVLAVGDAAGHLVRVDVDRGVARPAVDGPDRRAVVDVHPVVAGPGVDDVRARVRVDDVVAVAAEHAVPGAA